MKEETKGNLYLGVCVVLGIFTILANMEPVGFILLAIGIVVWIGRKVLGYFTGKA
jgi:uncharacterized membrane protein